MTTETLRDERAELLLGEGAPKNRLENQMVIAWALYKEGKESVDPYYDLHRNEVMIIFNDKGYSKLYEKIEKEIHEKEPSAEKLNDGYPSITLQKFKEYVGL